MPDETQDRDFQGFYEQAQALAFSRRKRTIPVPIRDAPLPEPGLLEKAGAMSPASWRTQEEIESMEAMSPEEAEKREEARAQLAEMDRQERIQRRETELKPWREWDVFQDGLLGKAAQSPLLAGFEGGVTEFGKSVALGTGTVASSAASMTVSALQTSVKLLTLGQARKVYEFSDNALGWVHELSDTARSEYFNHLRESSYAGGPVGEWGVAAAEIAGNIGVLAGEMAFRLMAMKIVTGHLYGQSGAVVSAQAEKAAKTFESLRNMPGMSKVASEAAQQANMVRSLSQAKTWADGVLRGTIGDQAMQRALGAIKMGVTSSLMRRYDTEGGEFLVDYLSNAGWATAFMGTTVASGMIGGAGFGSIIRIGADFGLNSVLSMARGEFGESFEQGYQEAKAAGLSEEEAIMRGNMQLGIVHLVNAVFASKTTSYASERAKAQYVAGRLPELQATAGRVENFKKEMVEAQRVGLLFEIDRRIHSSERAGREDSEPTLQRLRNERAQWANAPDDDVVAHSLVWMRDNLGFDLSKQSETYLKDLERNVTNALESNRQIREDKHKTAENQRRAKDLRGNPEPTAAKIVRALSVAEWDNVGGKLGESLEVHVKGIRERVQQELSVRASSLEGPQRTALNRRAGAIGRMGVPKLLATAQELFPKSGDFNRQFGAQGRAIIDGVVKAIDDAKQEADQRVLFPEDQLQGLKSYASWVREAQPDIARVMAEQSAVEREVVERVATVETEARQAADERKTERDEVERVQDARQAEAPVEPERTGETREVRDAVQERETTEVDVRQQAETRTEVGAEVRDETQREAQAVDADIGPRPIDSFGADLTAKLHEHVARALGRTFSGDAKESPKDNAERAWDLLRHESSKLPKDVRQALDLLAPTKADAERLYEFREYAVSQNREISNRQAEERATILARKGTAAIEKELQRFSDSLQSVDSESRAVADAEANRIFAGLSEDESAGLFRHLWGRQAGTEDGDPARLSPAQREAVVEMDRLMAEELGRVNYARQQEGLDPIQQLPNYFPLLRPGQFAGAAEVFQQGRSLSQMFATFNSPESIHDRTDGIKDIGLYAQNAKAQFHHYMRTMRAYSAMRTDFDGDDSRATDIYNAIHNMSRRAYTPDVIMAREAWAKAQDEGAKEPRTDLERVGADFERNLDSMRDNLAKRDMIDDVSEIPSREENRLMADARDSSSEGRMIPIRKIEALIVHPLAIASKIDGTRSFETGELGPNERLTYRGAIEAPAQAMRLIEKMASGLRKVMHDNGYGEHTWIRGDAKLTRINHWQERHIDDFEKMSDADIARVVETSDMPDMPVYKKLPMMFARTISERDVKAYRAILAETQRLYREAEPHFTKMYAIRHKAFKDAHFRDMGDRQSFFAKVEALVSRIAVAETQADNINAALKLSRFYRSSGFGTEQQRAVLSDYWRDTALVSWARGPHEWDKSWFSRGLQDDKRDQQESLRPRDWLDKGRDLINRKGAFEQVVRTTNAYLPRLFLAGNPRWSLTKQWTSAVGGAGSVGLHNLARGMAVNAYNTLMETLANRGLVDQPARDEGEMGWRGSELREIKQQRSMAVSMHEQDQQKLRRSVRQVATSFANSLSRVMEDGLTGSMMEAALIRGRNLGMTGDRLKYFAVKTAGVSQSIYNRDSRQVLLNSQIFRFFAPFQSFAFDAFTTMVWEPTRAGGMAGRERLGYVLQGMMAVAMVNYLSEWMFGRKAFQSVDPDTPSWQPWMSYGSFIPIIGAGRGPRGNYEIPAYNAVWSPIYRSLQRFFDTGDVVRLGKDTSPFFVAAMGLPSAQMVPQVVDTFDAMRYDGMAFTRHGTPFKALGDDSLFEYYTDIVMGLAFGPERSPRAMRRIDEDSERKQ